MAGSKTFSFGGARRKMKSFKDSDSDPLNSAEVEYPGSRAANHRSSSPCSTRGQRAGRFLSNKTSLASMNTHEAESQSSLTASGGPDRAAKGSARPDRARTSRTDSPRLQNKQLKMELSSSTLRSYYDPTKSPLAVSQQTSASSARDFALRKGCPPVIPTSRSDNSVVHEAESAPLRGKGAPKKRPSRLDFSKLFPRPLPQSGPMLSPQRYTNSPPPLSANSEVAFRDFLNQSSLHNKETDEPQDRMIARQPQNLRQTMGNPDMLFGKTNLQKPRCRVRNWFAGLQAEINEKDPSYEPDVQPDFVEAAFRSTSSEDGEAAFRSLEESSKQLRLNYSTQQPSFGGPGRSVSPQIKALKNRQPRETSRKYGTKAEITSSCCSRTRALSTLDYADLYEQSVLCLSSSDDEDDNAPRIEQGRSTQQKGLCLRDSLGADSIDSKVEIGTARAVDTSFLRMANSPDQSSDLRQSSFSKRKSNVERLRAIDIPERGSSRQAVPPKERQSMVPGLSIGVSRGPCLPHGDHKSLSTPRSTTTSPAMAQTPGSLLMALSPQEASLLEAMRSKRATMRGLILSEHYDDAADAGRSSISTYGRQQGLDRSTWSRPADKKLVSGNRDHHEVGKKCAVVAASTEQSFPSGRVSLIFSESVSSPTTGRDSPATPTMDATRDLHSAQDLANCHNSSLHTANSDQFSDSEFRTGSIHNFGLGNFGRPQKESLGSGEWPWVFDELEERTDLTTMH